MNKQRISEADKRSLRISAVFAALALLLVFLTECEAHDGFYVGVGIGKNGLNQDYWLGRPLLPFQHNGIFALGSGSQAAHHCRMIRLCPEPAIIDKHDWIRAQHRCNQ